MKQKEFCIRCNNSTPYQFNTPITLSRYYIEESGQLGEKCFYELYTGLGALRSKINACRTSEERFLEPWDSPKEKPRKPILGFYNSFNCLIPLIILPIPFCKLSQSLADSDRRPESIVLLQSR